MKYPYGYSTVIFRCNGSIQEIFLMIISSVSSAQKKKHTKMINSYMLCKPNKCSTSMSLLEETKKTTLSVSSSMLIIEVFGIYHPPMLVLKMLTVTLSKMSTMWRLELLT